MGEIGFGKSLMPTRSASALARITGEFQASGAETARPLVSEVTAPGDMLSLYVDRRYAALWPTIDSWSGAGWETLSRRYLEGLRREWQTTQNFETATNYARALAAAGAYQSVVTLFTPMLVFLAPIVSRALAALGRTVDAANILTTVGPVLPAKGAEAMRLNLSGNLARLHYSLQHWDEVIVRSTAWLATAKALGAEVNRSAILQTETLRDCALVKAGRADEAATGIASIVVARHAMPSPALQFYACTGDLAKARSLLIDSLADLDNRRWALAMVQPGTSSDPTPQTRADFDFFQKLRADPAVRAAAEKVGRILPAPIADTLPDGFDPAAPAVPMRVSPDSI